MKSPKEIITALLQIARVADELLAKEQAGMRLTFENMNALDAALRQLDVPAGEGERLALAESALKVFMIDCVEDYLAMLEGVEFESSRKKLMEAALKFTSPVVVVNASQIDPEVLKSFINEPSGMTLTPDVPMAQSEDAPCAACGGWGSKRQQRMVEDVLSTPVDATTHLLSTSANAAHLERSLEQARSGQATTRELLDDMAAVPAFNPVEPALAPNTLYIRTTDKNGLLATQFHGSTFEPQHEANVMIAALEFERAKRLHNTPILAHKAGELWMSTLDPVIISQDFYTHRAAWRTAIERCKAASELDHAMRPATYRDSDDPSYWQHELEAFDRTFNTLPADSTEKRLVIPEVVMNAWLGETHDKVMKVHGDAELLNNLRRVCGYVENGSSEAVTICQDDATNDWGVSVGYTGLGGRKRHYHARSFHQALRLAVDGELRDKEEDGQ